MVHLRAQKEYETGKRNKGARSPLSRGSPSPIPFDGLSITIKPERGHLARAAREPGLLPNVNDQPSEQLLESGCRKVLVIREGLGNSQSPHDLERHVIDNSGFTCGSSGVRFPGTRQV